MVRESSILTDPLRRAAAAVFGFTLFYVSASSELRSLDPAQVPG
ncbi:MAG: hypothetical protein V3R89_04880 [Thermoanaerobaculia bacterium]